MCKKKLSASGVAMALSLAAVSPAMADTILMDWDQNGTFEEVDAIDWYPGNALAVDAVPLQAGDTFTTYIQAEANQVTSSSGTNEFLPTGATGNYEITYVIELQETIGFAIDLDGDNIPDSVSFNHTGGTVKIFWDDLTDAVGINADGLTGNSGLGYDDGTLILSANIVPALLGASFSLTNGSINNTIQLLDQNGGDQLGGVLTVTGSGNASVDSLVVSYDTNFFQGIGTDTIIEFLLNATLENPFDSVNPELLVGGVAPVYGANNTNGIYGGTGTESFHFEADANSSFKVASVPEPGIIALLGMGLAGAGVARRRRKTA